MTEAIDIGRPQDQKLELVFVRIGFEDHLLGCLVIAVAALGATRKILGDVGIGLPPRVVNTHRAHVHEALHVRETHRLRNIARAAEIDVESVRKGLLHLAADKTRSMNHSRNIVRLHGGN